MEHPKERYYKLNSFFLWITGLWPYQNARNARIIWTLITVVIMSSVYFQSLSILTAEITIDYMVEVIPVYLTTTGTLLHLYLRIIHIDKLKEIFDRIWSDWALKKTKDELQIMQKYAGTSRSISFYIALQTFGVLLIWILVLYAPDILDVISPMNESRPRPIFFKLEYLVPEEQYISLIRVHVSVVLFVIITVFTTRMILFAVMTQHICGMCELLWYRAERLFCVENTAERDSSRRAKLIYRNTAVFVQLHQNIIQFVGITEHLHTIPFLMDMLGVMTTLCFTLMQVVSITNDMETAVRSTISASIQILYLAVHNYFAHQVMDNSSKICDTVYNSAWYDAAVAQQKPLLLIIRRRVQPLVLTACKFYVMSLPNFGKILQLTVSYCMFMRQF